jgi:hypothetical protein
MQRSGAVRPFVDLAHLVLLIAIGGALGFAAAHYMLTAPPVTNVPQLHSPPPTKAEGVVIGRLLAYAGAATLVGFGLVNRMLRSSMFVVSIGSPIALLIALLFSVLVGYFALPGVIVWRVWRCIVPPRPARACAASFCRCSTRQC